MSMREQDLYKKRQAQSNQSSKLRNRLQGMADSRSMQGMLSRGKNVYNGGSPQAKMGPEQKLMEDRRIMDAERNRAQGAVTQAPTQVNSPVEALSRLEQARDLAMKSKQQDLQTAQQSAAARQQQSGVGGAISALQNAMGNRKAGGNMAGQQDAMKEAMRRKLAHQQQAQQRG